VPRMSVRDCQNNWRPAIESRVGDCQPSLLTWRNWRVFNRSLFTSVSHINAFCKRQPESVANADIWKRR
jgi:hypothetical protein